MRLSSSFAVVLLFFLLAPPLHAQDTGDSPTLILSVRASDETSATVTRIVTSSIELHLEREGLFSVPTDLPRAETALSPALVAAAKDLGTPWVLLVDLAQTAQDVAVTLSVVAADGAGTAASVSAVVPVGLTLDRAVVELTDELIESARPALAASPPKAPPVQEVPRTGTSAPDGLLPPGDSDTAAAGPQPGPGIPVAPAPANHLLAVGVRYTPFIPVAGSSRYLDVSLAGVAAVVAVLPLQTDLLAVGLGLNGLMTRASGASAAAAVQAGSISLLLRIAGSGGGFAPFLSLRGGVSLIAAENETLGSFSGLAPYGAAQIGTDLPIAGGLSLQLAVDFELLFEQSILIMGFSPGVGLEIRI